MKATSSAGAAMRTPTTMPAPSVDVESREGSMLAPSRVKTGEARENTPPARPAKRPPPSFAMERFNRTGSVRARRILATA